MKKFFISFFLIILFCFFSVSCVNENELKALNGKTVLQASLFSTWGGKYIFEIQETHIFTVSQYKVKDGKPTHVDYKEKKLNNKEYNNIINSILNAGEFRGDNSNGFDGWQVVLNYNNKEMTFTYGESVNSKYDEIVSLLIGLSPVPIDIIE